MDAAVIPVLDDELLDQLARIFMRAALDELLRGMEQEEQSDEICAADHASSRVR